MHSLRSWLARALFAEASNAFIQDDDRDDWSDSRSCGRRHLDGVGSNELSRSLAHDE
jgi:hypothetical protein